MDIFGIGPTELAFIILIALILLGPKEMEKTGRTLGRFLRNLTRSDGWRAFQDTSREVRNLPNRLMREANFEEMQKDLGKIGKDIEESADIKGYGTWTNSSAAKPKPPRSQPVLGETKEKPEPTPIPTLPTETEKDAKPDA